MKNLATANTALFTEQLRPNKLSQVLTVPRITEELSKGLVDNILLCGSPGTGKTTISRILCQGHATLEINASLENGIDIIRNKVVSFSTESSLLNGTEQLKVVLLEECDNLTKDAWMSLRATIERFYKTVRFVANCNYVEKIPEPILSRFNVIQINPINQEEEKQLFDAYVNRVKQILNVCSIAYTDEAVNEFVKVDFPDMRSIVKKIQQLCTRGLKDLSVESLKKNFDYSSLFNLIVSNGDPWNNYKVLVGEWANKAEDALIIIGKDFPEYLRQVLPNQIDKLPLIIIAVAEYQSQLANAVDKFVVLLACVYKIQLILNS